MKPSQEQVSEAYDLMCRHAFLFWNARDIISADERMYNAPVWISIQFHTEYPTLGTYLEWWATTKWGRFQKNNRSYLVYQFGGFPGSGRCITQAGRDDGEHYRFVDGGMLTHLKEFLNAKARAKERFQNPVLEPYTLKQVVEMLNNEESYIRYKVLSEWQQSQIKQLTDERDYWEDKYYRQLTEPYREQLEPMLGRYHHLLSEAESEPQKKKKELLRYWADTCLFDVLHKCYPDKITVRREAREFLPVVEKYIKFEPCD